MTLLDGTNKIDGISVTVADSYNECQNEINVDSDDCHIEDVVQNPIYHEILTCRPLLCGKKHDLTELRRYEDAFTCECGQEYNIKQNF